MKARQRSRWAYAWLLAAWAAAGCTEDNPNVIGATCFPACRAGTVCSPGGQCVSACNPACSATQTCVGSGASAQCVADAGFAADVGATVDTGTAPADTGAAPADDGTAPTDNGSAPNDTGTSPVDSGAGPTDAGGPVDVYTPPMNCGMPGQTCCVGRACYGGGYCEGGTCRAPSARDPGECNSAADCPTGQGCGGPFVCGGGPDAGVNDAGAIATRRCFHCETPPGAAAFGAACTNGGDCQGGICSSGRCTVSCPVGEAGDAQCRARGATQRCVNLFFQPVAMGPLTTLGVCAPSCARDADCAADAACVPRLNYFTDRMDFSCAPPGATATTPIGAACNPSASSNTCRNFFCISTSATAGYCTGPCTVDADCPASASHCRPIGFSRPSGAIQDGLACNPT
ncbi:MAG: hypothetical protein JWM10_1709 [Myxococcaceae bacterium]|nr:hypothetical protein [Myxococcaceae bacterium]